MSAQIKKVVFGALTAKADEAAGVAFAFPDGETVTIRLSELPREMVERLAVHGLSQKGGDSYASAGSEENPLGAAKEWLKATLEDLRKGAWRVTTAGGFRATMLARALARVTGQTVEAAQAVVDLNSELDDDGKPSENGKAWLKKMRANEQIKAATAAITLEDQKAKEAKLKAQAAKAGGDAGDLAALFQ